jgi:hypothetical protein
MAVKSYLGLKSVLILLVCALFSTLTSGTVSTTAGIGVIVAVISTGYPFAVSEKAGLDSLYPTLSLSKKQVVSGRYLFIFLFDISTVTFAYISAALGKLLSQIFGHNISNYGISWEFLAVSSAFIIIQLIQIPFYFKFSYSKAKFMTVIPFAAIFALYGVVGISVNGISLEMIIMEFLSKLVENKLMLAAVTLTVLSITVFISYQLSMAFYKKREF